MNPDFAALLRAFNVNRVRYIVVGAYAFSFHAFARATKDLDLWVDPTPGNARRVMKSLRDFGAALRGATEDDFARPGTIFQMGVPPRRIDLITELSGLEFDAAWRRRKRGDWEGLRVSFLDRESLIRNKRAVGRPQDLVDVDELEKLR